MIVIISGKRWKTLLKRIEEAEQAATAHVSREHSVFCEDVPAGIIAEMLMDHLGLNYEKGYPTRSKLSKRRTT